MRSVARYLLLFLAWNVVVSLVVALSIGLGYPLVGLLLMIGLYAAFLRRLIAHPGVPARRWALLRLRPLKGEALRWTLLGIPVLLLLSWALGEVYIRLVPVPPENFDPFGAFMETPSGRLAITALAVGIAPVLEEFFFRGFIQRLLERRFGTMAGIGGGAAIFAVVHVLPWVFPLHFFLGVAFGYAVYATRSIWAGVILHAANNAVAVAGIGFEGEEMDPTPTVWQVGPDPEWWVSLLLLFLGAALAAAVGRRLHKAGRQRSLRLQPHGG